MTTKKQKREAGAKRAAEQRQQSIESGLKAQRRDREIRAAKKARKEETALFSFGEHTIN